MKTSTSLVSMRGGAALAFARRRLHARDVGRASAAAQNWRLPGGVAFRTVVVERDIVGLDNGFASIS